MCVGLSYCQELPTTTYLYYKSSQNFTQHYVVEKSPTDQTKSNITSFNDGFLYFDQKVLPLSAPLDEPGILGHIHLLTLF